MKSDLDTETSRLAIFLAGPDGDSDAMKDLLHWLGLRGFTQGCREYFEVLVELEPYFESLLKECPNLEPALTKLLRVRELQSQLTVPGSIHSYGDERAPGTGFELSAPNEWLTYPETPVWPLPKAAPIAITIPNARRSPAFLKLFAVSIVLELVWSPFQHHKNEVLSEALVLLPDLRSCLPSHILWPSEGDFTMRMSSDEFMRFREEIAERQLTRFDQYLSEAMPGGAAEVTASNCIELIIQGFQSKAAQKGMKPKAKRLLAVLASRFESLAEILANTHLDEDCHPDILLPKFATGPNPNTPKVESRLTERRWANRATIDLTDRQLLGEHDTALTPSIRDRVQQLVKLGEIPNSQLCTEPKHNLEVLSGYLLRICLPTGQLLDEAATTRVMPHEQLVKLANDQPLSRGVISYLPGDVNGAARKYFWNPPDSPPIHKLELLWPPAWETHCIDFSVGEVLPLRTEDIIPEVKEFVAKRVGKREATSRLLIKHALGREIFGYNTNRAAIRYICGNGKEELDFAPERSSLHHYIAFNCSAVTNAFRVAQARLFKEDWLINSEGFLTEHSPASACMVIKPERIRQVLGQQRKQIEQANIQDPFRLHNNFVRYIALVLLMCSGHRETKQLFHFAFSLNLKDAIAFVSDKRRVGSEARFIPLPAIVVDLINAYFTHITWLVGVLELDGNPLAEEVKIACGIKNSDSPRPANAAGLLFKFFGGSLRPIGTDDIAKTVARLEARNPDGQQFELAITARTLRRNLATYFANRDVSGDGISFLLGHNGKLNLWGAGSYRVPKHRLDAAREHLAQYLCVNEAVAVDPHWAKKVTRSLSPLVPSFKVSGEAFEGRKQLSDLASARARMAVLRVIDIEDLEERGISCIDDDVLKEIREEVRFELKSDKEACDKVLTELARLVDRWRKAGVQNASAALINLTRFMPGPVGIDFGRNLAIANHAASTASTSVKRYLDRNENRLLNQLAVAALLLTVSEAVLSLDDLKALTLALQKDGATRHDGQLRIRASVETRHAKYERTCDLSDKCAPAAIGYLKLKEQFAHSGEPQTEHAWDAIAAELDVLVRCFFDSEAGIKFKDLMAIMRPYWLLRLPGTIYACCVGTFDTSAESKEATQLMLEGETSNQSQAAVRARREPMSMEMGVQAAVAAVNAMLASTSGRPEDKTSNKRTARANLRSALNLTPLDTLSTWAAEQPIVETWLEFMRHLLKYGGPRTDSYAHSSLLKYQGVVVALLFKHGWDCDLRDFKKAEDYDNFYGMVYGDPQLDQVHGVTTVLKIFHQFLRDQYGAPRCKRFPSGQPRQRTARNIVLSHSAIVGALDLAHHDGGRPTKFNHAAAGLIAVNAQYGLRVMEGIGLLHRDLVRGAFSEAHVKRNTTRYIKTRHGTRRVCVSLGSPRLYVEVNAIFAVNEKYGREDGGKNLIFADPDQPQVLLETGQIRSIASWAIKRSTGDMSAILYSLRHTWATSALARFLVIEPSAPITKALLAALPELDEREIEFLKPASENYCLGVDRIAMWLGHASINQIIPTYGHCIWWACSDYCFKDAQVDPFDNVAIAKLLNVGRPGFLHHLPKRELTETRSEPEFRAHAVNLAVSWYTSDKLFPPIVSHALKTPKAIVMPEPPKRPLKLPFLEKLFDIRAHDKGVTLSNLASNLVNEFDIQVTTADALTNAYLNLLKETKFRDFEPSEQRLGRDARTGVLNSQVHRRTLLSKIQKLCDGSSQRCETVASIARDWARNVNSSTPFLVCDSLSRLKVSLAWLNSLGYGSEDLVVYTYHTNNADLNRLANDVRGTVETAVPVSRHDAVVPAAEFGIEVASGNELPFGRNFQRVMFTLAVWERTGFMNPSQSDPPVLIKKSKRI